MQRDLIDSIRRGHGFDGAAQHAADGPVVALRGKLERALERLSSDLYNKKTHFLLEFIQNADDNDYSSNVAPSLELHVEDRLIIFQCNELGFSSANVKAICDIGGSTKTAAKKGRGFIGEKGIGFKSVFTVADQVFISSGGYQFMFDRSLPLGMITPIPDTTYPAKPGWTTFHLRLAATEDGSRLSVPLREVRPTLLLFLRQLRCLTITVNAGGGHSNIVLTRDDIHDDTARLSRLEDGKVWHERYLRISHTVRTPSAELKREGVEESEIVLAFPVTETLEPLVSKQDVHAFLPLRCYGFNFIIQADFLTSASREDVLTDLPWNTTLRSGVVDAFLIAIEQFIQRPTLRDVWFRYLPEAISDTFFMKVEHSILSTLRDRPILRSSDGTYRHPGQMVTFPSRFCDDQGSPLIIEDYLPTGLWYLAQDYDTIRDGHQFRRLGVMEMTDYMFLHGLSAMIDAHQLDNRDDSWHDNVCGHLLRMRMRGGPFRPEILPLRILPLKDGSWAAALFAKRFTFDLNSQSVPTDLGLQSIKPGVELTPLRYRLFLDLGVKHADPVFIASKILTAAGPRTVKELVVHAQFFFDHRAIPGLPVPRQLRVADHLCAMGQGDELYLDLPASRALGALREVLSPSARFLHPDYLNAYADDQRADWLLWLKERVGLNVFPRVVGGYLCPEFLETVNLMDTPKFLLTLRNYWPFVRPSLSEDGLRQIGECSVKCSDGTRQRLNTTYLQRDVLKKYQNLHFLPVADPSSREWEFLSEVGVALHMDAAFFVGLLQRMSESKGHDMAAAEDVYRQLDARFFEDEDLIRMAFDKHPIILVSVSGGVDTAWYRRLGGVYWHGPPSITSKPILSRSYPTLSDFFFNKLKIMNAPPYELVDEIRAFGEVFKGRKLATSADWDRIGSLLTDLSDAVSEIDRAPLLQSFSTLRDQSIFPVHCSASSDVHLQAAHQFYIGDRAETYADVFRGRVALLALPPSMSLSRIRALLESEIYKSQAHSPCRLVYHSRRAEPTQKQKDFLIKLKNIVVWNVRSISTILTLDDCTVTTIDDVAVEDDDKKFSVLVSQTLSSSSSIDPFICEALSRALDVDMMRLFTCVTPPLEMLEHILRLDGVDDIEPDSQNDRSWLQALANPYVPVVPKTPQKKPSKNASSSPFQSSISQLPDSSDPDFFLSPSAFPPLGSSPSSASSKASLPLNHPSSSSSSSLPNSPMRSPARSLYSTMASPKSPSSPQNRRNEFTKMEAHSLPPKLGRKARPKRQGPTKTDSTFGSTIQPPSEGTDSEGTATHLGDSSGAFVRARSPSPRESDALSQAPEPPTRPPSAATSISASSPMAGTLALDSHPGPSSMNFNAPPTEETDAIGVAGELFVYNFLCRTLGPTFGPQNWTSELRGQVPGFTPFAGNALADVTYVDFEGILTALWFGPEMWQYWAGSWPTFHIEVKSTSGADMDPFHMSRRQMNTALFMTRRDVYAIPRDVFIILRVSGVNSPSPQFTVHTDPHLCLYTGRLLVASDIYLQTG
ncbi:hypothetical protein BV25DRAFT_1919220 [Artomyces pyxidatus]|uniref:Uncharacterized protein n=1 Tax=Artomyces pyxidatus TaxID=48021 RepID=A0ACB8SQ14_9AGAM|nr:hypothetical protein BV25DRAFT_1919220 [Artomyces pyxidatus]